MTKKNKIEPASSNNSCLSASTINNYLAGKLNDEEKESVRKHINGCEFCADAVEGYKNMKLKDSIIGTVGHINKEIDKKTELRNYKLLFIKRKILAYSSLAASVLILVGLFLIINNSRIRRNNIISEKLALKKDNQLNQEEHEQNKESGSLSRYESLPKDAQREKAVLPEEHIMPVTSVDVAEYHDKAERTDITESKVSPDLEEPEAETDMEVTVSGNIKNAGTSAAGEVEISEPLRYEEFKARDTKYAKKAYSQPEEILPAGIRNEETLYNAATISAGVDEFPKFEIKGIEHFKEYVQKNLQYPAKAKKLKIEGEVLVNFTVDTSGRVTDPRIIKGIDSLLNSEALRVVSSSPPWLPGKKDEKPVKATYTIPVIFKIK